MLTHMKHGLICNEESEDSSEWTDWMKGLGIGR